MIDSIPSPFKHIASPGVMCVILDSSFDPELLTHLFSGDDQNQLQCIPLFLGTPYAELQSAGPYMILCPANGASSAFAGTLLEQADAGCVAWLSNAQTLEPAIEHWRSVLTVHTDEEPLQMMRFFDPRWLEPLIRSLSEAERIQFIGPFSGLAWRNEMGWRYFAQAPKSPAPPLQPPAWLYLSPEHQARIDQERLKVIAARFAEDYREVLPASDTVEYVYRQLLAGQQAGYEQMADQERWLRLAVRRGDSFWAHYPDAELLARSDVALGDKLTQLESL